jgi:hypothetical protein
VGTGGPPGAGEEGHPPGAIQLQGGKKVLAETGGDFVGPDGGQAFHGHREHSVDRGARDGFKPLCLPACREVVGSHPHKEPSKGKEDGNYCRVCNRDKHHCPHCRGDCLESIKEHLHACLRA